MNRIVNGLFAFAAGTCAMVACTSEPINDANGMSPEEDLIEVTLNATIDGNETKAALEDNKILWGVQDSIRVYEATSSGDHGRKFTSKNDEPSSSVDFSGEMPEKYKNGFYASYPYGLDEDYKQRMGLYIKGETTTLVLPWIETRSTTEGTEGYEAATSGTFDPLTTVLVAKSDDSDKSELNFKSALAFIKLTTDFSCSSITIKGNNDETLTCGMLNVTFDDDDNPVTGMDMSSTTYKYARIRNTDSSISTSTIEAGTYYIAVMPQTLENGFSITFENLNGYPLTGTRSTTKKATLSRGKVLNLGVMEYSTLDRKEGSFLGEGTEASPYLITRKADLELLAAKLKTKDETEYCNKHYRMTNDIDYEGEKATPIGSGTYFKGTFDGGGHTIKNYLASTVKRTAYNDDDFHRDRCGLFYGIAEATVKNLNAVVSGFDLDFTTGDASSFVQLSPFIAGARNSTVKNCHVSGTQIFILDLNSKDMDPHQFGGVIGMTIGSADIEDCSNSMTMSVTLREKTRTDMYSIGGIIGYCRPNGEESIVKINRCRNTGNLQLTGKQDLQTGGIIGLVEDTLGGDIDLALTNCVNKGAITAGFEGEESLFADNAMSGGIVGYMNSDGGDKDPYIYNCLNTGSIYAYQCDAWSGGLVGYVYDNDTHIFRCASCGDVKVKDGENLNPLVGNDKGTYKELYWTQSYFNRFWYTVSYQIMNSISMDEIKDWSDYLRNPVTLVDWKGRWDSDWWHTDLDIDF